MDIQSMAGGLLGGMGGGMTAMVILKGLDQVSGPAREAGNALTKLKQHIGALGLSFVAMGGAAAWTLGNMGAEAMQTERAFREMARSIGADADFLRKKLKELSGGTLSDLEIMAAANRAMLTGLSPETITESMRIARAAATATGTTVLEQFDRITSGIARMEGELLKTGGIIVQAEDAYKKYAEQLGKSVSELTTFEKQQAFTNETLRVGAELVDRVGEAGSNLTEMEIFQQLSAAMKDLQVAIGKALLPTVLRFVDVAKKVVEVIGQHPQAIANTIQAITALGVALVSLKAILTGINALMSASPAMLLAMAAAGVIAYTVFRKFKDELSFLSDPLKDAKDQFWELIDTIDHMNQVELEEAKTKLDELAATIRESGEAGWGNLDTIVSDAMEKINARMEQLNAVTENQTKKVSVLEAAWNALTQSLELSENAEENVQNQANKTIETLINQKKETKSKHETVDEFGNRLRELGLDEEYVQKAMKDGFIELKTEADLLGALGDKYKEYINTVRERMGLKPISMKDEDAWKNYAAQLDSAKEAESTANEEVQGMVTSLDQQRSATIGKTSAQGEYNTSLAQTLELYNRLASSEPVTRDEAMGMRAQLRGMAGRQNKTGTETIISPEMYSAIWGPEIAATQKTMGIGAEPGYSSGYAQQVKQVNVLLREQNQLLRERSQLLSTGREAEKSLAFTFSQEMRSRRP